MTTLVRTALSDEYCHWKYRTVLNTHSTCLLHDQPYIHSFFLQLLPHMQHPRLDPTSRAEDMTASSHMHKGVLAPWRDIIYTRMHNTQHKKNQRRISSKPVGMEHAVATNWRARNKRCGPNNIHREPSGQRQNTLDVTTIMWLILMSVGLVCWAAAP